MDTETVFNGFATELKAAFGIDDISINIEETVAHVESDYFPHVLPILQRDSTFFSEPRILFDVDLSACWNVATDEQKEMIWKYLQGSLFASFLHGDIKDKVGTIISTLKTMWTGKDDEISKILEDEESEGHFKELLDFVMNTRLAKMFMEIVEDFDVSELELNFNSPQEILDIIKNPEHPVIQKVVGKIQTILEDKMKKGIITQQQIVGEVEAIKAKVTGLFGNIFNEALGGRPATNSAATLMGNSPEARRQRMLARLQKKHRDKNSK